MFRGCYFEYAGRYSGDYNLITAYVQDSYDEFSSGGSYEPVTDTLPYTAEALLYGMRYSDKPLEFSIEIINPDDTIPFEQMREIKSWLFGQDGWKKLYIKDENLSKYYLLCLLIPESDIVDATGYRGLRCTVKNISPFWYGEEKTKTITYEEMKDKLTVGLNYEFDINVDTDSPLPVPVTINFTEPGEFNGHGTILNREFWVKNKTNGSLLRMLIGVDYEGESWSFDARSLHFKTLHTEATIGYAPTDVTSDVFYLQKGLNHISIACHDSEKDILYYKDFSISFIPCYRIGGL